MTNAEDKLTIIVRDSGLEATKARVLLTRFTDYFDIAAEWELKAKAIIVTDDTQTGDMQMARAGRLFLKDKRVAIEKTRKSLKEQSLREGKAIDGIANVLKALIVPIEEHLHKQEKFVEIRAKKIEDKRQAEEAQKAEDMRLAAEEAERLDRERIKADNERLRKEANEKDRLMAEERAKADAEKLAAEQKAIDERRIAEDEKRKAEAERIAIEKKAADEKLVSEAEIAKLKREAEEQPTDKGMVTCPECGHQFETK